ncbi:MAG: LytTR family DNA-binding domain-containing protein [Bryobacteraceae bacterium]
MRAILVEDSRLARVEMRRLLAAHSDIEIAAEAANAEEAERLVIELQPDLVFLDIQLPGRDGFELLASLDATPMVIFCTAYNEFAVRAFERNALDYLVKPVQPERLARALERARQALGRQTHDPSKRRDLLRLTDRVFVKDGEDCWFVPLNEVRLFETEGTYTRLYFGTHRPLIPKTLNYLETRLDPQAFFRASRRHMVNLQWVKEVEPWFAGGLRLTLKDGQNIEVSRRQAQRFREVMSL